MTDSTDETKQEYQRVKVICPNGHVNTTPEWARGAQTETCSECGARWVA